MKVIEYSWRIDYLDMLVLYCVYAVQFCVGRYRELIFGISHQSFGLFNVIVNNVMLCNPSTTVTGNLAHCLDAIHVFLNMIQVSQLHILFKFSKLGVVEICYPLINIYIYKTNTL